LFFLFFSSFIADRFFFFIHIPSRSRLRHASPLSRRPLATCLPFATDCPSSRLCRIPPSLRAAPSPRAAFALAAPPLVMHRLCRVTPSSHIVVRVSHRHVAMLGSACSVVPSHAPLPHARVMHRNGGEGLMWSSGWAGGNSRNIIRYNLVVGLHTK
jgi:hypothetical protein